MLDEHLIIIGLLIAILFVIITNRKERLVAVVDPEQYVNSTLTRGY